MFLVSNTQLSPFLRPDDFLHENQRPFVGSFCVYCSGGTPSPSGGGRGGLVSGHSRGHSLLGQAQSIWSDAAEPSSLPGLRPYPPFAVSSGLTWPSSQRSIFHRNMDGQVWEGERRVTRKEKHRFQEFLTAFVPNTPNRESRLGFAEADPCSHVSLAGTRAERTDN